MRYLPLLVASLLVSNSYAQVMDMFTGRDIRESISKEECERHGLTQEDVAVLLGTIAPATAPPLKSHKTQLIVPVKSAVVPVASTQPPTPMVESKPTLTTVPPNSSEEQITEYNVVSWSMLPALPIGCSIEVDTQTKFSDIKEGDIIVYTTRRANRYNTPYITHRVYKKMSNYLICKGDSNAHVDREEITEDNFVGKVVSVCKK